MTTVETLVYSVEIHEIENIMNPTVPKSYLASVVQHHTKTAERVVLKEFKGLTIRTPYDHACTWLYKHLAN